MTHNEQVDRIISIVCDYIYMVKPNDEELNSVPDLVRKARETFDEEEKCNCTNFLN